MGNCSLKGANEIPKSPNNNVNTIRVLTDSGIILSFESPKLVQEVIKDFPGYGVFKRGQGSAPLDGLESLFSSHFYYLLPLEDGQGEMKCSGRSASIPSGPTGSPSSSLKEPAHVTGPREERKLPGSTSSPLDSSSSPSEGAAVNGPGDEEESKLSGSTSRPSGLVENLASGAGLEVLRHNGNGVWKVKLVIGTKQLEEILAEEVNVEALVERMREAAAAAAAAAAATATTAVRNNPSPKKREKKANRGVGWKPNLFKVSSHC